MTDADIEATKAPLMDHLIELRARLIKALVAFVVMFVVCFYFAKDIYNILVVPFEHAAGPDARNHRSPRCRNARQLALAHRKQQGILRMKIGERLGQVLGEPR